jgi:SPP1 family phage portal protein
LTYSKAFELYYIDSDAKFCSKIISPRHGKAVMDDVGEIEMFLYIFRVGYDTKLYIDLYTENEIIHCDETFMEVADRQPNVFGCVPVGIASLSDEGWLDTIYKDIKDLQDAYEINLSDLSQEITEFRNAYLVLNNYKIDEGDVALMKKMGIIETKGDKTSTQFLTKNINDTFVQNTLKTIEEKMFQITAHINPNEKMQSNTSSLSLRARLISLEQKCKLNEKALANCIKTRLCMMFCYLNKLKGTNYDCLDVKCKFSPNIPTDITATSQMIRVLGDKLSLETALAQLPFVDNVAEEIAKIKAEMQVNSIGESLLNPPIVRETITGAPIPTTPNTSTTPTMPTTPTMKPMMAK